MPLPPAPRSLENLPDSSGWVPMPDIRYTASGQRQPAPSKPAPKKWFDRIPLLGKRGAKKSRPHFLDLPPNDEQA